MSASWRASDVAVLGVAAAGTVLLTAASFVVAPPDALPRNDGSSYATHADGAAAAFRVLKELGYQVERSFEPLSALGNLPETTTLVLAGPLQKPSEQDVRALRVFLERGGRVLATGPGGADFLPGIPQGFASRARRPRRQSASLPSPLSSGVVEIDMPVASAPLKADSPFLPIYGTDEEAGVLVARFGTGVAVWWAGSAPLVNRGIGGPGHVELLVNSLGPPGGRAVLWDEFYHGHTRSFWSYLAGTPLPIAMLQLAGMVGLALFTFTRRRRPIRPPVVEARTSPLEFIDTMGGLYERARAAHAAVGTVRERVRRRLLDAVGLPPSTTDERLGGAAGERLSLGPEVSAILSRAQADSVDYNLTPAQAVSTVAELQALAARAHESQRQRQRKP